MQKLKLILFSFTTVSLLAFLGGSASASQYPSDYADQNVRVQWLGSNAFVAYVSSGMMSKNVLGYKKSGPLAATNPDTIDAIVTVKCMERGSVWTFMNVVKITKEWGGRGYLSGETRLLGDHAPEACLSNPVLSIAFSDGNNHWEPGGGVNYELDQREFFSGSAELYRTGEPGPYGSDRINDKAWQFLIQKL